MLENSAAASFLTAVRKYIYISTRRIISEIQLLPFLVFSEEISVYYTLRIELLYSLGVLPALFLKHFEKY